MVENDNRQEPVFCIIKFGKKEHLEKLLDRGELCFNPTQLYNSIEQINPEQGDNYEGAEWIENTFIKKINVSHPTLGEFNFKPDPKSPSKFIQYNHNYLTCSFYIITPRDFRQSNVLKINKKMLEFGSHAVIIKDPDRFLTQLKNTLDSTYFSYVTGLVQYKVVSGIGRHEMNPFRKKEEHSYQKEFRIVLKNELNQKHLKLGSIKDYAELVSSKFIVEANWEANRN